MTSKRDPKIAKRLRRGEPAAAVADRYALTDRRVQQIARAAGVETRAGRPLTGALTPHTAAGRTALAQLVADARAVGLPVPEYLTRARRWLTMERDDLERIEDARRETDD